MCSDYTFILSDISAITNKGLFVEVMPSANNVARARSDVISAMSFLQRHFDLQNHSHFPFRSKPQA